MALLLIKNSPHWMDKLTESEVQARADKDPGFMDSYNARYQKGDVVEVREDNAPFGKKEQLPNFLVIKVDGKKADYLHLMEPDIETLAAEKDQELEEKTLHRRKYKFDIDAKVAKSRLDEIETSKEWIIDTYEARELTDKTAALVKG